MATKDMDGEIDPNRLQKWLSDIVSTEPDEVDCNVLAIMIETIVAIGSEGKDIRTALPIIAVHLDHCPECGEWYDTIVAMSRE
jgi:hypothetical protein